MTDPITAIRRDHASEASVARRSRAIHRAAIAVLASRIAKAVTTVRLTHPCHAGITRSTTAVRRAIATGFAGRIARTIAARRLAGGGRTRHAVLRTGRASTVSRTGAAILAGRIACSVPAGRLTYARDAGLRAGGTYAVRRAGAAILTAIARTVAAGIIAHVGVGDRAHDLGGLGSDRNRRESGAVRAVSHRSGSQIARTRALRRAGRVVEAANGVVARASSRNVYAGNIGVISGKAGAGPRRFAYRMGTGCNRDVAGAVSVGRVGELGHPVDLQVE